MNGHQMKLRLNARTNNGNRYKTVLWIVLAPTGAALNRLGQNLSGTRASMKNQLVRATLAITLSALFAASGTPAASAMASGAQAELRSSAALLAAQAPGTQAPTAPAGGVVVGAQPWVCDAASGFAPVVSVEPGIVDPMLAIGVGAIPLPISTTNVPATGGQMAHDGNGKVYITQGVVDTKNTPAVSRGILREVVDPLTGALVGPGVYIATTAGLDGSQPTAAAVGPDGNLYVAFLKSGNIKRIVNPGFGTTQVVQSVGNTPSGHFARALAFVGNDLYIGSIDAFSVIHNATSASCTGGCNATTISDGFAGVPHVGLASDGVDAVYFAVSGSNQVWRYTPSTSSFAFIAQGGADRNGGNASSFSFVPGKTNLLTLDAGGNLWIGDDTSDATAAGAGRIWTISSLTLASVTGGSPTGGTNTQAIANVLRGPWFALVGSTLFTATFNADGTFTATIQSSAGVITTDSGTWALTPPLVQSAFANPQGNLTLTDSRGLVLLTGDALLINADQLVILNGTDSIDQVPFFGTVVLTKQTV